VQAPVLVAAGTRDDIAGSPAGLAALFPNGQSLDIPDRDHMVAVGDRVFKSGALAFLKGRA
jgi:non-heme chloroperoxidase